MNLKRDFREKPYSSAPKIPPSQKNLNMLKKYSGSTDSGSYADFEKYYLDIAKELEATAQKQCGIFEFEFNEEFHYIHIKVTAENILPMQFAGIFRPSAHPCSTYFVSIEPVDSDAVCISVIIGNVKM